MCALCVHFSGTAGTKPLRNFFVGKEEEIMADIVQSLESALMPIVVNINTYLSNYILVFMLLGVGLWYSF